MLIMQKRLQV